MANNQYIKEITDYYLSKLYDFINGNCTLKSVLKEISEEIKKNINGCFSYNKPDYTFNLETNKKDNLNIKLLKIIESSNLEFLIVFFKDEMKKEILEKLKEY